MKAATPWSASHCAMFTPSWSTQRLLWPPPGMTSTAAPFALSLAGRKGVIDGLWMVETLRSPLADATTVSGSFFPSEPGAPWAQRVISGFWAIAGMMERVSARKRSRSFMLGSHAKVVSRGPDLLLSRARMSSGETNWRLAARSAGSSTSAAGAFEPFLPYISLAKRHHLFVSPRRAECSRYHCCRRSAFAPVGPRDDGGRRVWRLSTRRADQASL